MPPHAVFLFYAGRISPAAESRIRQPHGASHEQESGGSASRRATGRFRRGPRHYRIWRAIWTVSFYRKSHRGYRHAQTPREDGHRRSHFHRYNPDSDIFVDWKRLKWPVGVPLVSIEGSKSTLSGWQVMPDDKAIGRLAAQEFLRRGFKRFAYCPAAQGLWTLRRENRTRTAWPASGPRSARTTPALNRRSMKFRKKSGADSSGNGPARWPGGWRRCRSRSASWPPHDLRARHVLLAAEIADVRVPEEAAVIGVGNGLIADFEARGVSSAKSTASASAMPPWKCSTNAWKANPSPPR